jgi:hypothetical protein
MDRVVAEDEIMLVRGGRAENEFGIICRRSWLRRISRHARRYPEDGEIDRVDFQALTLESIIDATAEVGATEIARALWHLITSPGHSRTAVLELASSELGGATTIDAELDASDEASFVARKEQHAVSDLHGLDEAAHRAVGDN